MKRLKRRATIAAGLLLAGAALFFSTGKSSRGVKESRGPDVDGEQATTARQRPAVSPSNDWAARTPELPPDVDVTIDAVEVDKQEVCKGEEAVVTIRAHSTNANGDDYLSYGVMGHPELVGSRFTLRPEESLGYKWMRVFVRGKRGTSAIADVPPVRVKDCETPHRLTIDLRRRPQMPDRAFLTARLASASGEGFQPVDYRWDFADGSTATTSIPEVEHSYEGRLQNRAYSYFFVTVTARNAGGRELQGSRSLRFVNLGFSPAGRERTVTIFSGVDEGARGGEKIWLYHGHPVAVRIDKVVVTDTVTDASGKQTVTASNSHDPASLLGFAELPPGKSLVTRDLTQLRPAEPAVARTVEVSGHAGGGDAASGSFILLAPKAALAQAPEEQP
jgi:hypothetical protein